MGKDTEIQWCDSTVNPTTGCDGCEIQIPGKPGTCYAAVIHTKRLTKSFPDKYDKDFHQVQMIPGRTAQAASWSDLTGTDRPDKPWLNGMPRMIFVGDMADLFSNAVTDEFIEREVFDVARSEKGKRHIWMLLTKQPHRMVGFRGGLRNPGSNWPENVWAGVSITSQRTIDRAKKVWHTRAENRFLSIEPQLGPIDISLPLLREFILVIQGGESGPGARPFDLEWARSLRDQCKNAGVPYFFKQAGSRPEPKEWWDESLQPHVRRIIRDSHGGDPSEWPDDLKDCRSFPARPEATHGGLMGT